MAKKGNRVQVILECTEHKTSGKPGTSRYITTKNRKNTTERQSQDHRMHRQLRDELRMPGAGNSGATCR